MIRQDLPAAVDPTALQRLDCARYPLLLQSVAGGNALSRWDILFIANGEGLYSRDGITHGLDGEVREGGFLPAFDAAFTQHTKIIDKDGLPFHGGWALYLGYEIAGQIETSLDLPAFTGPLPDALALRCPAAILFDRVDNRCLAVAEPGYGHLLSAIQADIAAAAALAPVPEWPQVGDCHEDAPERFTSGVARILDYLKAGDVFQVNLSRAWNGRFPGADAYALYARLCRMNPAPFAGLLRFADWALLSSSPERLVSVSAGKAQTRPIAGTRPRMPGDDEAAKIRELIGHPKERAEHVMLIDLERNDLSRVCEPGSVKVDELMCVETYAHVHHIVSNITGSLKPGTSPGEVISAVFPGGTITGCPKVRCMEIIAELEQGGRGPYTGALGYVDGNGDMDLNILIRSLWLQGDRLQLRAGGGIVADSNPDNELQETRAKAKGLLRAIGAVE
ncbi:aminodeoxychorismate synthase component I [Arenimonas sp. GDDSR-1]|uniref:aminodeoxychorismate synthase component I n=1 Tax=Arenimonas sp. GDDSR-1 TaxID=2950125 RepID=UPI00262F640B|nr:aminodeoxychorismate synthase component I [Arenimonas sp. GDDSR-1]